MATERLKSYLDPLLFTETPNVIHMQYYLSHNKSSSDKEQPSPKILSTYQVSNKILDQLSFLIFFNMINFFLPFKECIMYQHQLNIIRGVWQRLESWKNSSKTPPTTLVSASSDKLRILAETLLDMLVYTFYEIGSIPSVS